MIALIPARKGSKRIPGKNTKLLAGHPLIAYTIAAARSSGIFEGIFVLTDDRGAADATWGCSDVVSIGREQSADDEPDIAWVRTFFEGVRPAGFEAFAILRPTSPFRTVATIRRAYEQFRTSEVHSIRAVQPVKEHPGKMWQWKGPGYPMSPLLDGWTCNGVPSHSCPTQSLPRVYVQNSSLEMAWSYVIQAFGTISGTKVAPFFTEGYEGFSLDYPEDWTRAEAIAAAHPEALPPLDVAAVSAAAPAL